MHPIHTLKQIYLDSALRCNELLCVIIEREEKYRLTGELLCSEAKVNHKEVYTQFAEHTPFHSKFSTWLPGIPALPYQDPT